MDVFAPILGWAQANREIFAEMLFWIPLLPLAGFFINGLFGRCKVIETVAGNVLSAIRPIGFAGGVNREYLGQCGTCPIADPRYCLGLSRPGQQRQRERRQ